MVDGCATSVFLLSYNSVTSDSVSVDNGNTNASLKQTEACMQNTISSTHTQTNCVYCFLCLILHSNGMTKTRMCFVILLLARIRIQSTFI